jgi:prepilin-type N-terminal cleavage/methylation domain-containing protein
VSRRRARGFSIVEVLAAMALFGVVAAAITALATTSVRFTIANRHATAASTLAQEELEDLRGLAYEDIDGRGRLATVNGQQFSIDTTVSVDDPAAGMKHIVVAVSWTGPEGSRSHELETIFTSLR